MEDQVNLYCEFTSTLLGALSVCLGFLRIRVEAFRGLGVYGFRAKGLLKGSWDL